MAQPALSPLAQELYNALAPLAIGDNDISGWPLARYCAAVAKGGDQVYNIVRDLGGVPGWSAVMSADTVPLEGLAWLAQFIGAVIPGGLTEAQQRAYVKSTDGWKRGSLAAIRGAAQQHLSGTQTVVIRERDRVACPTMPEEGLTVITYKSQAPADVVPVKWGAPFNWIRNPDFEVDLSFWNPFGGAGTTLPAESRVAPGRDGTGNAGRYALTGSATQVNNYVSWMSISPTLANLQAYALPVIPGQQVYGGLAARATTSAGAMAPFQMGFAFYDINGVLVSYVYPTNPQVSNPVASTWYDLTFQVAVPAGAAYAITRANYGLPGGFAINAVVTFDIDNAWLSTVNTGYFSGSSAGMAWEGTPHESRSMQPYQWTSSTVLADILKQKPAGLILNYVINPGQDYLSVRTNNPTYAALRAKYATYNGMRTDTPGA